MAINPTPIPVESLPSLMCPISLEVMRDPVIDKHGHSFERSVIEQWLLRKNVCPLNNEPLTMQDLAPNRALKEIAAAFASKTFTIERPVEDLSSQVVQNDTISGPLLEAAQKKEKEQKYAEAEELYSQALKFTSKSEDYAHLPRLFENMGQSTRAAHGYVTLSNLQLREGKKDEAIASIRKSLTLYEELSVKEKLAELLVEQGQTQEAACLFLELAQYALYHKDAAKAAPYCLKSIKLNPANPEAWKILASIEKDPFEVLMRGAQISMMPIKERIRLCQMALLKSPKDIEARLLLLELERIKMKAKIHQLKRALKTTTEEIKGDLKKVKYPEIFGAKQWREKFGDVGEEPPLPTTGLENYFLQHFIFDASNSSPIHIKDALAFLLIPETLNGKPLTMRSLLDICGVTIRKDDEVWSYCGNTHISDAKKVPVNARHGTLFDRFFTNINWEAPVGKSYWILLNNHGHLSSNWNNHRYPLNADQTVHWRKMNFQEAVINGIVRGDLNWYYEDSSCKNQYLRVRYRERELTASLIESQYGEQNRNYAQIRKAEMRCSSESSYIYSF